MAFRLSYDQLKTISDCLTSNKDYPFVESLNIFLKDKKDDTTIKNIKVLQLRVSKIICNKCKSNVTSTMRCNTCHPKENQS